MAYARQKGTFGFAGGLANVPGLPQLRVAQFQRLGGAGELIEEMFGIDGIADPDGDILQVDGLGEKIIGAGFDAEQPLFPVRQRGHQQNRNGRGLGIAFESPAQPAASAFALSPFIAWAVSAITGICRVAGSCLSNWVASRPSRSGRLMSMRIRSGRSARAKAMPLAASSAFTTV